MPTPDIASKADIDNLRHMLGATSHTPKRDWGYRNHFAAGIADTPSMERLVAAGLVVREGRLGSSQHYYYATEAGCKAAGLNRAQTKRALED